MENFDLFRIVFLSFRSALALILVFILNCSNNGILSKLENPGGSGASAAVQSCGTNCRIYVTTATFAGNLGGVSGADNICLGNANNPSGSGKGSWKALIAGGGRVACTTTNCTTSGIAENSNWVLRPGTNYRRAGDEFPIGTTTAAAIFSFNLANAMAATTVTAWTGLTTDWLVNGNTCASWVDSSTGQGMTGRTLDSTFSNIAYQGEPCTGSFSLFCAEQ